jgi:ABC-2 type transport system ATP-binding protein
VTAVEPLTSPFAAPDRDSADPLRDTAAAAVEISHLRCEFGPLTAVADLELQVPAGQILGLLGPNGAGKTTTIKMLITLLPPTAGTARVAGHDIVREPVAVRRSVGYVPQLVSADGALTGTENLQVSARLYHLPRAGRGPAIAEALDFMGLGEAAERLTRTYSGGMVRRLELAQAMLHRPAVLFLDEPTVGLDPTARDLVWAHVEQLRAERGTTIVVTTHYMAEAEALCDQVAIMHHGRVVAQGTVPELRASAGPGASLDDVFRQVTGGDIDTGGNLREVTRTRRTARRLG